MNGFCVKAVATPLNSTSVPGERRFSNRFAFPRPSTSFSVTSGALPCDMARTICFGWRSGLLNEWQVRLARDRRSTEWRFREGNEVIWHNPELDLALIQVLAPEEEPLKPQFGLRVATLRTNDRPVVEIRGYPRASKREDGKRRLTSTSGRLKSDEADGPLVFGVEASDLPNTPRSGWPGISGSLVLLPDSPDPEFIWAYGVVREIPPYFDKQLAVARLADAWTTDPKFRDLLVAAGAPDEDAEDPLEASAARSRTARVRRNNNYERAINRTREHLSRGLVLRALDELLNCFSVRWEPSDGWATWERLGYDLSQRIVSIPAEELLDYETMW